MSLRAQKEQRSRVKYLGFNRSQPDLDRNRIDREADPEGDSEELARREMAELLGCEEDAHYGTRGGNSEKDCNCAHHPKPLFKTKLGKLRKLPRFRKGKKEERVKEQNR